MKRCIALDLDCAETCAYAVATIARDSQYVREVCALCAKVCEECGAQCAKHEAQHCQDCARTCRECAQACRAMA
ncbi:four-helix bundle copper-binding protein [Cupriavidus necator]